MIWYQKTGENSKKNNHKWEKFQLNFEKNKKKRPSRTAIFSFTAAKKDILNIQQLISKRNSFLRVKSFHGDLDGKIQANVRNKTRYSSVLESCSRVIASIQNLIQEIKTVVFENDELEFRDMSELKVL